MRNNHKAARIGARMTSKSDRANVIIPPPIAWALAFLAGLALDWARPLPFDRPGLRLIGIMVVAAGIALALTAVVAFRRSGTHLEPYKPTTAIVSDGPYRFTRNPIYLGMFLGQVGLALAINSIWLLVTLLPFYLVIRHGVVAREERYLERKFGRTYLDYQSRVRRWL